MGRYISTSSSSSSYYYIIIIVNKSCFFIQWQSLRGQSALQRRRGEGGNNIRQKLNNASASTRTGMYTSHTGQRQTDRLLYTLYFLYFVQTDGWTNGWTDGIMDRQIHCFTQPNTNSNSSISLFQSHASLHCQSGGL